MKIPISKYKLKEKSGDSDEDAIDDEFTEEEIRSLYPASELLNKIYSDHVYTASRNDSQSKPEQDNRKEKSKNLASSSGNNINATNVTSVDPDMQKNNVIYKLWHPIPVPMLNPNLKITATTSTQKMPTNSRHRNKNSDADISASLNAESIQQVFQNMINMTSLAPMVDSSVTTKRVDGEPIENQTLTASSDTDKGCKDNADTKTDKQNELVSKLSDKQSSNSEKVQDAESSKDDKPAIIKRKKNAKPRKSRAATHFDPKSLITGNRINSEQKCELKTMSGSSPRPSGSKSREFLKVGVKSNSSSETTGEDKYTDAQQMTIYQQSLKYKAVEQEINTLLHATTSLLVQRWGEYLHMTTSEINDSAVKEAKDAGVIEEVVEMLEDTGRYVWTLIDDLTFF